MRAFLDGDRVCIVDKHFVNLQESPAIFVSVRDFYDFMQNNDGDEVSDQLHDGHLIGECFTCRDGL